MNRLLPLALGVLLLAGCAASAPEPDKHLLLAYDGPLPSAAATQRPQLVVRGVMVPDYLERRGIAYRAAGNELKNYSGAEWAERPGRGITRWVSQALAAARADYDVQAFTTGDQLPQAVLAISLDAAEADSDGQFRLRGAYSFFANGSRSVLSGRFDADAPMSSNSPEASVAALQSALALAVKHMGEQLPAASALPETALPPAASKP